MQSKTVIKQVQIPIQSSPPELFHISRGQRLHDTRSFTESRPEDPVRVLEHAILQRNNDEL